MKANQDIRLTKTINKVAKGVPVQVAQRQSGYSRAYSRSNKLKKTKKYKEAIFDIVKELGDEREAIIARLKKTRNKAKYRDLIDGLDKVTKNMQLLTGKNTENLGFNLGKVLDDAKKLREKNKER